MKTNWTSILGEYSLNDTEVIFKRGKVEYDRGSSGAALANFICNQTFGGGKISADISFKSVDVPSACELMVYYDPETQDFVSVGIGGSGYMYSIRSFSGKWTEHALIGEYKNLKVDTNYHVEVEMKGSRIYLKVDDISVLSTKFPNNLPMSQVGIWCHSYHDIHINNFKVEREKPKAFVVMQFSSPYNELYEDVIKTVCEDFDLDVVRADETYGPGLILADITKQIYESKLIIAEISPVNANVFYEVGFAHALNKPTILIAEKTTKLPFDVSPFRTLFYENTIAGKKKIDEGLRKHIQASLSERE
ncbi:MAG: hypothetical protein HQ510_12270 [Candidatus Marinimicrobia bacterium]|nr:hypothetical protein [Candidatus Neomarinimicrobiota bacterium]